MSRAEAIRFTLAALIIYGAASMCFVATIDAATGHPTGVSDTMLAFVFGGCMLGLIWVGWFLNRQLDVIRDLRTALKAQEDRYSHHV